MAHAFYYNILTEAMKGNVDVDTDVFKAMFVKSTYTPNRNNKYYADISAHEIAAGNGYSAGGFVVSATISNNTTLFKHVFDISDPTISASGGSIGPYRYLIIYDDTPVAKPLIDLLDPGEEETLNDTGTFLWTIDTNGLYRMG